MNDITNQKFMKEMELNSKIFEERINKLNCDYNEDKPKKKEYNKINLSNKNYNKKSNILFKKLKLNNIKKDNNHYISNSDLNKKENYFVYNTDNNINKENDKEKKENKKFIFKNNIIDKIGNNKLQKAQSFNQNFRENKNDYNNKKLTEELKTNIIEKTV